MGILVKIFKKEKKFKLWSTVVDTYYFGDRKLTRQEAVSYLKNRVMKRAKADCAEIENTFPNGYCEKSKRSKYIYFTHPKELKNKPQKP